MKANKKLSKELAAKQNWEDWKFAQIQKGAKIILKTKNSKS